MCDLQRRCSVKDPVSFFHLTVYVKMEFSGKDARAARRWFYDKIKQYPAIFAGFDGPRDPIVMTFYSDAGNQVVDLLNIWLPQQSFSDLVIKMSYQCSQNPEHSGTYQFIQKKHSTILDKIVEMIPEQLKLR